MAANFLDPDYQRKVEARRQQQDQYRNQLEEQKDINIQGKKQVWKIRDGQMSEKEFSDFENKRINSFKQQLLDRISRNDKNLSTFDKQEAEELAKLDAEFAKRLTVAKQAALKPQQQKNPTEDQPIKSPLSKFEQLKQKQQEEDERKKNQQQAEYQDVQVELEAEPEEKIVNSTMKLQQPSQQIQQPNTLYQPQAPQIIYPPYIPQQQNQDLTNILLQMQKPSQFELQMMQELQNQKQMFQDLKDKENKQQIQNLEQKILQLEQQIQQQSQERLSGRIQQLEESRKNVNQQMEIVQQEVQMRIQQEPFQQQKDELSKIEERNRQRWKILNMIDQEFGM